MALYNPFGLQEAAESVNDENMFEMMREVQLMSMALIFAASNTVVGPPPEGMFPDRTIREDINGGFRVILRPVHYLSTEDNATYLFRYEEITEII